MMKKMQKDQDNIGQQKWQGGSKFVSSYNIKYNSRILFFPANYYYFRFCGDRRIVRVRSVWVVIGVGAGAAVVVAVVCRRIRVFGPFPGRTTTIM